MLTIVIALILLAVAAPGSCKSGRCGVRRKAEEAALLDKAEGNQRE